MIVYGAAPPFHETRKFTDCPSSMTVADGVTVAGDGRSLGRNRITITIATTTMAAMRTALRIFSDEGNGQKRAKSVI